MFKLLQFKMARTPLRGLEGLVYCKVAVVNRQKFWYDAKVGSLGGVSMTEARLQWWWKVAQMSENVTDDGQQDVCSSSFDSTVRLEIGRYEMTSTEFSPGFLTIGLMNASLNLVGKWPVVNDRL